MSDRRFTFFELHLHDSDLQLGPKSIGGAGESASTADTDGGAPADETGASDTGETTGQESESSRAKAGLAALVGLALLVGIAVAVKKLTGDEADLDVLEELEELDELDEGEE